MAQLCSNFRWEGLLDDLVRRRSSLAISSSLVAKLHAPLQPFRIRFELKNNYSTEMYSGSEAGSY